MRARLDVNDPLNMSAFLAASTSNTLREIPLMTFRVGDTVAPIAVRSGLELVHDGRASLDGAVVVLVDVAHVDVETLRRHAELFRIVIFLRRMSHHDRVAADFHRGVDGF